MAQKINYKELKKKLKLSEAALRTEHKLTDENLNSLRKLASRVITNVLSHKFTGIGCNIDDDIETSIGAS